MKKILLTLALLSGFTLANEVIYITNVQKQIETRVKRTNDMKIQMSQMNMQNKTTHLQSHDTMQMSQYQNMTQQHAAQQFEKEFTSDTYSANEHAYSN